MQQQLNEQIKRIRHPKGAHRHTELEVIQALRKLGAGSSHDIGAELNLSHKWIEDKLRLLKAANRIYISDWERKVNVGPYRIVYSLKQSSEDKDVPKPKRKSGTQKTTEYRIRQRQLKLLGLKRDTNVK